VDDFCADGAQGTIANGLTDAVSWIFSLFLAVVPQNLSSSHSSQSTSSEMAFASGTRVTTPGVFLLMNVNQFVLTVGIFVVVPIFPSSASINLLDLALVKIFFVTAGFPAVDDFVGGLFTTYYDLLRGRFLDDDGLGRFIANNNGLWRGLFRTEKFGGPRIPLQFAVRLSCRLQLVLAFYAILPHGGWRGRAFYFSFDAVLADLVANG